MGGDESPALIAKFFWAQLFGNAPVPTQNSFSFKGQTVIITGSNTGLGFEAAKYAVKLGCAKLIIAVRTVEKGETAKRSIVQLTKCDPEIIEVWSIDLTSYDSIKAFAERADRDLDRVDVLLENAGVASVVWNFVQDHERMVAVNVISTFLLAFLMLPKLKATAAKFDTRPRLTVVSSDRHFAVDFKEKDEPGGIFKALNDKTKSDVAERYELSKLLQVFIVREMAARLSKGQESTPIIMNCVNPGLCKSELSREVDSVMVNIIKFILARSAEQGSRNLIHGAGGELSTHGQYLDMGKAKAPASVVVGPGGEETQRRLYAELVEILEKIVPGVTDNL